MGGKSDDTIGLDERRKQSGADELVLRIVGDGIHREQPLPPEGMLLIGRAETADVRIDDPSVSRKHAILHTGARLRIEDLGGQNGTSIAGKRLEVEQPADVAVGDVIAVGAVMLVVTSKRAEEAEAPAIVVRDPKMIELHRLIERIAKGDISVLLLGETGVGKEAIAETVHRRSDRAHKPLLRINSAALNDTLLESELFGHVRGAFTGAERDKAGLLETADGGTVFLDEVGELTLSIQAKLLRVLEDRKVTRVGGLEAKPIDVRFISATNRDLEAAVERGEFRRDLFFRLNGFSLVVPPLRERTLEIEPLAKKFLAEASRTAKRSSAPELSAAALAALRAWSWPGNIRELRNTIERAVLLAGDRIEPEHLPLEKMRAVPVGPPALTLPPGSASAFSPAPSSSNLKGELDTIERQRILDALEACGGNQTRAAKMLGISRNTLAARLEAYGSPRPRKVPR